MCVIVYKPENVKMPKKKILETCFDSNPDGAGYMYVADNKVHIRKGFVKFKDFYKSLEKTMKSVGDEIPYVLHFRISTQANGRKDCTHPYPLSSKMDDLRLLSCSCNVGIAHNGIISLTSSSYNKTITYNDTMLFITDYLSIILKNREYDYYNDEDTLTLIKRLCGSKLAILDRSGHCELIGDFILDDGVYYSNSSYIPYKPTYKLTNNFKDYLVDYDYYDEYSSKRELNDDYYYQYYNKETDLYDFEEDDCPYVYEGEILDYYCERCSNQTCPYSRFCIDYYEDNNDDKIINEKGEDK